MSGARLKKISRWIIPCCLTLSILPTALAQSGEGVEYPVKLAFLYNFTKFIEWPSASYHDPGASLTICIVGHDPFDRDLEEQLRARKVKGHPVGLRTLRPDDSPAGCHIVFVPATENALTAKIVRDLKGSSALTVGETAGFALLGGIINLTVESNRVRFEVNLPAAPRSGLKISSHLPNVVEIVKE
jgi:hypothetical protein